MYIPILDGHLKMLRIYHMGMAPIFFLDHKIKPHVEGGVVNPWLTGGITMAGSSIGGSSPSLKTQTSIIPVQKTQIRMELKKLKLRSSMWSTSLEAEHPLFYTAYARDSRDTILLFPPRIIHFGMILGPF
jgi:hypothetical protein